MSISYLGCEKAAGWHLLHYSGGSHEKELYFRGLTKGLNRKYFSATINCTGFMLITYEPALSLDYTWLGSSSTSSSDEAIPDFSF
jgi:hypothetical protein